MVHMDLIIGHVLFAFTFAQLVPCEYEGERAATSLSSNGFSRRRDSLRVEIEYQSRATVRARVMPRR